MQDWIDQGRVEVDGAAAKRSRTLKGAERVRVEPAELPPLRATPRWGGAAVVGWGGVARSFRPPPPGPGSPAGG